MIARFVRRWGQSASGWSKGRARRSLSTSSNTDDDIKRPSLEDVDAAAHFNTPSGYPTDLLVKSANLGDKGSSREVLIRHVMLVDSCEWEEADKVVSNIQVDNETGLLKHKLPYLLGITFGFVSAWGSIPMVFDLNTALWFNEQYVTTEIPPPEDLETFLEVGAWTWNWMEPWTGTISFQLLALQLMRLQMLNVGFRPYTAFVISQRQARLRSKWPQYTGHALDTFCLHSTGLGESVNE